MAIECRVVARFPLRDSTPAQVRWEGVLEWTTTDRQTPQGWNERLLKLQCGMREGQHGLFLTMPNIRRFDPTTGRMAAVKDNQGRYRNYAEVGPLFQQSGIKAVQDFLAANPMPGGMATGPTAVPDQYDAREAAQQTFRESAGQEGIAPVGVSTPDDPFGDLPW